MDKTRSFLKIIICTVFLLLSSTGWCAEAQKITVEADGDGVSKLDALKEAWTVAVRKAVGLSTVASTKVVNDKLTEEIAEYSRGQVDSFEILDESHTDGLWHIKIRANVDRELLEQTIAPDRDNVIKIDGAQLAASLKTNEDQSEDAVQLVTTSQLLDFSRCLELKSSLVTFNIEGRERLFMKHVLKMNLDKFHRQAAELEKLVSRVARSRKVIDPLFTSFAENELRVIAMPDYSLAFNWEEMSRSLNDMKLGGLQALYLANPYNGIPEDPNKKYNYKISIVVNGMSFSFPLENKKIFSSSGNFLTNAFFWGPGYDGRPSFCFLRKDCSLSCYTFNGNLDWLYGYSKKWKLDLYCESGAGDNKILAKTELDVSYPAAYIFGDPEIFTKTPVITPAMNVQSAMDLIQIPVILCWQRLEISPDELANIKELRGRFELVPTE